MPAWLPICMYIFADRNVCMLYKVGWIQVVRYVQDDTGQCTHKMECQASWSLKNDSH